MFNIEDLVKDTGVREAIAAEVKRLKSVDELKTKIAAYSRDLAAAEKKVTEDGLTDDFSQRTVDLAQMSMELAQLRKVLEVCEQRRQQTMSAIGAAEVAYTRNWRDAAEKSVQDLDRKMKPHLAALKELDGVEYGPVSWKIPTKRSNLLQEIRQCDSRILLANDLVAMGETLFASAAEIKQAAASGGHGHPFAFLVNLWR